MSRFATFLALILVFAIGAPSVAAAAKKKPQRRGGTVEAAWPRKQGAKPPPHPLAQWLAKQVGPVTPAKPKRRRASRNRLVATAAATGTSTSSLLLVRSFEIPKTDADFDRLGNLSWTYDNALAAIAFIDQRSRSQAEQLLDQLQALQLTDGSLAFAYNVATATSSGAPRANELAWVGIAAVTYRERYNSSRYDKLIGGVAKYLLALRRTDGLVMGGADVQWVSTQHNLLAAEFFRRTGLEFGRSSITGLSGTGTDLTNAYNAAATSIVGKLLVSSGSTAYFVQGLNDARIPLDAQALGSVFLEMRKDSRATLVANWMKANLYQSPRVVNGRTWSGYQPFAGSTAPNVIWSEGTIQAYWAFGRVDVSAPEAAVAVYGIYGTTNNGATGPMGADRAVFDRAWGEFPAWPTSAGGSWLLILAGGGDVLYS